MGRLALLALAVTAGIGVTRAVPAHQAPVRREVQMRSVSFMPGDLMVAVGDTVVWKNVDIVRHNAVRPELFETGELAPGQQYAWVPADTGTFTYRCTIHRRMRGTIVVR